MNKGIWYGIGAYACWGLFPIYWKWLTHVSALELIAHRIIWSCVILVSILLATRQWQAFRQAIQAPRVLRIYLVAAILIGVNWLVYVWAIISGYVVESSLGYFINPLVSVSLGVLILRERLRPGQWLPILLAAFGVIYLAFAYGKPPWIALTLACTFGIYGLVKKTAPLNSLYGLGLETGILILPATFYLLFAEFSGQGAFLHTGIIADALMLGAGVVTTIPLLMFASAARRIPLSLMGVLQYLAPTLQFLCGIWIYGEPFSQTQLIGFAFVWVALIIFAVEGFVAHRTQAAAVVVE